jgi:hypothetical protein
MSLPTEQVVIYRKKFLTAAHCSNRSKSASTTPPRTVTNMGCNNRSLIRTLLHSIQCFVNSERVIF